MNLKDLKKDIPETPEFIHTMIQNEVRKQLQETKVVEIGKRREKKWTGARVAAAAAVCVLAVSSIAYAGSRLYHVFVEKQGTTALQPESGQMREPEK